MRFVSSPNLASSPHRPSSAACPLRLAQAGNFPTRRFRRRSNSPARGEYCLLRGVINRRDAFVRQENAAADHPVFAEPALLQAYGIVKTETVDHQAATA